MVISYDKSVPDEFFKQSNHYLTFDQNDQVCIAAKEQLFEPFD